MPATVVFCWLFASTTGHPLIGHPCIPCQGITMRKHAARRRAIVNVLKDARAQARISQRALSEKLGEASTYIHEVETGQHGVRTEEFIAIAEALDVDPVELLGRV